MLLLLFALVAPQDTVRISPVALVDRAVALDGRIASADARTAASVERASVAGRFGNPTLSVEAENLGVQEEITGWRGFKGTEGQAVLSLPLAMGGDRGARRDRAAAATGLATAHREVVVAEVREAILLALIDWERESALAAATAVERENLASLARMMTARAREGRDAASDAALARLEADAAASRDARQQAVATAANARLAALLALPAGTVIQLSPLACRVPSGFDEAGRAAELRLLDASVQEAKANASLARALRIPDLEPQVGLRRSAGFSGLLVGVAFELPVWNSGGAELHAAKWEVQAAEEERRAMLQAWQGERSGHRQALTALLASAERRDSTWVTDLDAVVIAEERRLEVGEGSLFRLFDARRARLNALIEREAWRDAVRRHQVALARLGVAPLTPDLLCVPEVQS